MPAVHPPSVKRRSARLAMLGWAFAWLGATGAISAWSAIRHAPALEQLIRNDVLEAMAPLGAESVAVTVTDHRVVLSGRTATDAERDAVIRVARGSLAIREVDDRLTVSRDESSIATLELVSESSDVSDVSDVSDEVDIASGSAEVALPDEDFPGADFPEDNAPAAGFPDDEFVVDFPDEEFFDEESVDSALDATPEVLDIEDTLDLALLAAEELPVEDDRHAESVALLAAEQSLETATDRTVSRQGPAERSPSLTLALADHVLTMNGSLASVDDSLALVDAAMESFDLEVVSNSVDTGTSVGHADWLDSLTALLPALATLQNPGIAIVERQVTLSGTAGDSQTRDAVVVAALERLGNYSLVERIDVMESSQDLEPSQGLEPSPGSETVSAGERIGETIEVARISGVDETPRKAARVNDRAPPARTLREAWDRLPDTRIPFEPNSDRLTVDSRRVLDRMADLLQAYPNVHVEIEGHTDATGEPDSNLRLSQLRANAVRDHLVSRGVEFDQLTAYGYGEGVPAADNRTRKGRAANRRIEFTF